LEGQELEITAVMAFAVSKSQNCELYYRFRLSYSRIVPEAGLPTNFKAVVGGLETG
jgi:hypothetical protein